MKLFTTLLLSLFGLFIFQSCSSDDDPDYSKHQETEVFVDVRNAAISSIVVKADGKTVFTSTYIEKKRFFILKVGYAKSISIETTAVVDENDVEAELRFGRVIGGDILSTSKEITKEKPIKGDELKLSGTMKFSYD